MNKENLKSFIKPLLKECIKELLLEEGLKNVIAEAKTETFKESIKEQKLVRKEEQPQKQVVNENRKKLLEEIGKTGYLTNSFDPFANTSPLTEAQASGNRNHGPMKDLDPSDPGVDISKLLNNNSKKIMKALVGGKAK